MASETAHVISEESAVQRITQIRMDIQWIEVICQIESAHRKSQHELVPETNILGNPHVRQEEAQIRVAVAYSLRGYTTVARTGQRKTRHKHQKKSARVRLQIFRVTPGSIFFACAMNLTHGCLARDLRKSERQVDRQRAV